MTETEKLKATLQLHLQLGSITQEQYDQQMAQLEMTTPPPLPQRLAVGMAVKAEAKATVDQCMSIAREAYRKKI